MAKMAEAELEEVKETWAVATVEDDVLKWGITFRFRRSRGSQRTL
jgi:hypothetical protein